MGLTRPELARITAFAKMWIYNALVPEPKSGTMVQQAYLDYYFPQPVRERFPEAIAGHMLRHEIVPTSMSESLLASTVQEIITAAPPDAVLSIRLAGPLTDAQWSVVTSARLREIAPRTMNVEVSAQTGFLRTSDTRITRIERISAD